MHDLRTYLYSCQRLVHARVYMFVPVCVDPFLQEVPSRCHTWGCNIMQRLNLRTVLAICKGGVSTESNTRPGQVTQHFTHAADSHEAPWSVLRGRSASADALYRKSPAHAASTGRRFSRDDCEPTGAVNPQPAGGPARGGPARAAVSRFVRRCVCAVATVLRALVVAVGVVTVALVGAVGGGSACFPRSYCRVVRRCCCCLVLAVLECGQGCHGLGVGSGGGFAISFLVCSEPSETMERHPPTRTGSVLHGPFCGRRGHKDMHTALRRTTSLASLLPGGKGAGGKYG